LPEPTRKLVAIVSTDSKKSDSRMGKDKLSRTNNLKGYIILLLCFIGLMILKELEVWTIKKVMNKARPVSIIDNKKLPFKI